VIFGGSLREVHAAAAGPIADRIAQHVLPASRDRTRFPVVTALPPTGDCSMHTLIVIVRGDDMAETAIARLFTHGRSQAVRLPKEFRLPGDRVRFRRVGDGVLLEPLAADVDTWFAELDRFADTPLFDDSGNQPSTPTGEDIFE
jgi:antitoxin VapB